MRQAFKPGEIYPETANRIGYELALEYTGGKHAFVVATHTDRDHVHNHIIFNAFNLEADGKFKDAYFNYRHVAEISDKLCKDYGLSVIEQKHGWRDPYNEWEQKQGITKEDKPPSNRQRLENIITKCLELKPKDFDHLLKMLKGYDCIVKRRGKNISITTPFSKKPIRLSSLSEEFDELALKEQIEKQHSQPQFQRQYTETYSDTQNHTPISASDFTHDNFAEAVNSEDEYSNNENAYGDYESENDIVDNHVADILAKLPLSMTPETLRRILQNGVDLHYADESDYEENAEYEENSEYEYQPELSAEEVHEETKDEFETLTAYPSNLKLIIDIQNSIKAKESIGYKKWCEKFNLEQMSQTLIFIEKHQLTFDELQNMATRTPQTLQNIKAEITGFEKEQEEIGAMQRHIGNYGKYSDIYKRYQNTQFHEQPQFWHDNEKELSAYKEANEHFSFYLYTAEKAGKARKMPTINELRQQYATLTAKKNSLWQKYHDTRNSDSGISNAWANVKTILNVPDEIVLSKQPPKRKAPSL